MAARHGWWRAGNGGPASPSRRNGVVAIALASFALAALMSQSSAWRLLDARAFDYLSTTFAPARPADGPVIVAIDEPSFAELGLQWPWPRDVHARLVEALRGAGARAIGLDIIFAEPSRDADDAALAGALGPDVVLAADESVIRTPHADTLVRVEPIEALTGTGARSGLSSVVLDGDGALRRLPRYHDGFAAVLLAQGGEGVPAIPAGALIQTFGPSRTYPTVSYYQALDPAGFLPPGYFAGRVVLVGLSMQSAPGVDAGGADAYATSWTPRTGRLVSGVEIQATIFDNLAAGLFVTPVSGAVSLLATALATFWAGFLVWRATGWRTLAVGVAAVAAMGAGSFLALRFGRLYMPPFAPALAFVATSLVQSGRDYAAERRQRREITRAFSRYLSPALVERLAADPSQLRLGGERRVLSVLFCDIRGFTPIAEAMRDDPEQLTALVNRIFDPLSEVILENGGTIDKYMGDAIMAFWNAPLDDPDHVAHAVGSGLAMIEAVARVNADLAAEAATDRPAPFIRIGVGIETGECFVGNFGSSARFDYSALGDTVNLASRLEGLTKSFDVPLLVGEETARRLAAPFAALALGRVAVKGKAAPVAVSTVLVDADAAALARHAALREALDAGRGGNVAARAAELGRSLPALAAYYRRLTAGTGGET